MLPELLRPDEAASQAAAHAGGGGITLSAIFDGHGGHVASSYAAERIAETLSSEQHDAWNRIGERYFSTGAP